MKKVKSILLSFIGVVIGLVVLMFLFLGKAAAAELLSDFFGFIGWILQWLLDAIRGLK